jgi:spore coat protein U-like protein
MILRTLITITLLFVLGINTVQAADCRIVDGKLNFGPLNDVKNKITVGEITVTCSGMTSDLPFSLSLENNNQLSMDNGQGGLMYYRLYTSANETILWNENNVIKGTIKNVGGYGKSVQPFYGRIINYNRLSKPGEYNNKSNLPVIKIIY